jgi:hypothetical protein
MNPKKEDTVHWALEGKGRWDEGAPKQHGKGKSMGKNLPTPL